MNTSHRAVSVRLFLLLLVFVLSSPANCLSEDTLKRVKWVPDGDTLLLQSGDWVRLVGVDTPETGKDGKQGQYYAREAQAILKQLVADGVVLRVTGRDRYRRLLAVAYTPSGLEINSELLRRGAAFYYWFKGHSARMRTAMVGVQIEAMSSGRGFWPRLRALPEWDKKWIVNKKSGRAFPAGSQAAQRVSVRNRMYFDSLEEVFRGGFSPARHVSPWPSASLQ